MIKQNQECDTVKVASDQQQASVEELPIKRGNENAVPQVGRSESHPGQPLSRAATLQQYINNKK